MNTHTLQLVHHKHYLGDGYDAKCSCGVRISPKPNGIAVYSTLEEAKEACIKVHEEHVIDILEKQYVAQFYGSLT